MRVCIHNVHTFYDNRMSQPDDIPLEKRFAMLDYVTDRISTENRFLSIVLPII